MEVKGGVRVALEGTQGRWEVPVRRREFQKGHEVGAQVW